MLLLKKWRVRGGVFLVPLALALVISFRGYIKRTGRPRSGKALQE
jgi:hypothetical protein